MRHAMRPTPGATPPDPPETPIQIGDSAIISLGCRGYQRSYRAGSAAPGPALRSTPLPALRSVVSAAFLGAALQPARCAAMLPALSLSALLILAVAACSGGGGKGNTNNNNQTTLPICGDGRVDPGEECDEGERNSDLAPDACRTDCRRAHCGDGVIDPGQGEACDGQSLANATCESIGQGFTGGTLACDSLCQLDTSGCSTCGNGLRETDEACDGLELGGATCASLTGLQQGIVGCDESCEHDTSACYTCGDGIIQTGPEDCEGADLAGQTCEGLGYTYGALSCGSDCRFSVIECHGQCGNGLAQPDEECDTADFKGHTCQTLGFVGGQLTCTGWCQRSVVQCHRCGNDSIDAGEECDGADTGGKTCESLTGGAMTGTLGCSSSCRLDTSGCQPPASCGNGLAEPAGGEQCDGADLDGQTCQSASGGLYAGGTLVCGPTCLFDTSACTLPSPCGNGMAEPEYGEQCDGADLQGATCQSRGFLGGTLACSPTCSFDTSGCQAPLTCGNNVREAAEACDGPDLGTATCQSLGFVGGSLACQANCTFNTTACLTCGDNVVNGDDQCDGAALGGQTCESLGYHGGTLACQQSCTYDLTSCQAAGWCGDNIHHPTSGEQCDGPDFGTLTCADYSFDGGVLTCTSTCQVSTATCATCGDGLCGVGEPGSCPQDCLLSPLSAGDAHTCYVKSDGTVWCWGGGIAFGNSATLNLLPTQVRATSSSYLTDVVSVSSGGSHNCILKTDGTVWCWGANESGQCGNGSTATPSFPVQVLGPQGLGLLENVASLAPSGTARHTCAVRSDGTAWCWGANASGQLGDGSTTPRSSPVQVVGPGGVGFLEDVAQVSTGSGHTCAVTTAGTLYCWGNGGSGRLGHGGAFPSTTPWEVTTLTEVATVSAGNEHTCAVKTDGSLFCWGMGADGRLGNGLITDSYFPTAVFALEEVSSVGAGGSHTCAIKNDGTAWCWGLNSSGQVGDGSWESRSLPVEVASGAVHLAAGVDHTCLDLGAQGLRCWGQNTNGQVGMGTSTRSLVPVPVISAPAATSIAVGAQHACAWQTGGGAWCWGDNTYGKLGDGTTTRRTTPVPVVGEGGAGALGDISTLSAGHSHTCAVLGDGTAWCWGRNTNGRLGDGTTATSYSPVQVLGQAGLGLLANVVSISAGYSYTCAALADGTAWCWGGNNVGQLGDGTNTTSITPVQVTGEAGVGFLSDVLTISSLAMYQYEHTCAALTDGTAWCWGENGLGQLGNGTTTTSYSPVQVLGPAGVGVLADLVDIHAGGRFTCAAKSNGTLWCWGYGANGRLGNGTGTTSYTPVQVGVTQASGLSCGTGHSCTLVAGGASSACWGWGSSGQLGNSSTTDSNLPVAPGGMSDLSSVVAGGETTCARKNDGSLWCWGSSSGGQLGNPDYYHQPSPRVVLDMP